MPPLLVELFHLEYRATTANPSAYPNGYVRVDAAAWRTFRRAVALTLGSLLFSMPTQAQLLPPAKRAQHVEIIEGSARLLDAFHRKENREG
jgi:hypothetical protein